MLLRQSIGLDATTVGVSTIERAVAERMKTCAIAGFGDYLDYLRGSPSELQELTEWVVVPETWFFRDEQTFAALGRIAADWLLQRPADTLRALSVPCSTGEEPYTIAMALHDSGMPRRQIAVDAVDISRRALACAQRGVYGKNSFRNQDLAFRERHFRTVPEGYAVQNWLAETIRFREGNLVKAHFPFLTAPYNVIFCRNVLIYFDRPTQEEVLETLGSMLAPDGILFVGPAEAYLAASWGFSPVRGPASFSFQRSAGRRAQPVPVAHAKSRAIKRAPPPELPRLESKPPIQAEHALPGKSELVDVRRLADRGRIADAVALCEQALTTAPSAEAYYLLGVLSDATGERDRAADCFRRAVYLEPDHAYALAHLAIVLEQQGDPAGAQRLRGRAKRANSAQESGNVITR
jgi:chemotaxis protein methyltransferase WspC